MKAMKENAANKFLPRGIFTDERTKAVCSWRQTNAGSGREKSAERFVAEPSNEPFYEVFLSLGPRVITYFRVGGGGIELADDEWMK